MRQKGRLNMNEHTGKTADEVGDFGVDAESSGSIEAPSDPKDRAKAIREVTPSANSAAMSGGKTEFEVPSAAAERKG